MAIQKAPKQKESSHSLSSVSEDLYATRIQSAFRGWWVRDFLAIDHYCATNIQRIFRGFVCRSNFQFDLFCIEIVQSAVRRWLARREFAARATTMTSTMENEELLRVQIAPAAAATAIQAQWRCYSSELNFLIICARIILIQSVVRGWITRKRRLKILPSARNNGVSRMYS